MDSSQSRPVQTAIPRPTEGKLTPEAQAKSLETRRARGRPKGSKNKAKALIPTELASKILLQMKETLPPEHYEYMRKVVREGGAVSVQREVQIMLLLLGRNLLPAILEETKADGDEDQYFRKDVTERLKVWNSLASMLFQMEKQSDEGTNPREKPVIEIFARSGIDGERIKILAGYESGDMGGNDNGDRGPQISSGTVPDQLAERPLDLSDSEQEPTVRVLDPDID